MDRTANAWRDFGRGLGNGILTAVASFAVVVYVLNMFGLVAVSVDAFPGLQAGLYWAYANLGLSLIPFLLILALYFHSLRRLNDMLKSAEPPAEQITQTEKWVDIASSLFFGTGVIWTAIGMRAALLYSLEGLDATSAAQLGAFGILQRLVDGGILLALSTTIFGGVGGYLMRVGKAVTVGAGLHRYYLHAARVHADAFDRRLQHIERDVARLAARIADEPTPATARPAS